VFTRRKLLTSAAQFGAAMAVSPGMVRSDEAEGVVLNDVQSQLNATRVHRVVRPTAMDDIAGTLRAAAREGRAVSVAGGRHAMGGQQFATDSVHLDTTSLNRVLGFDQQQGRITVEAGIEWPELLDYLHRRQEGLPESWTIRQKQTGVDRVSLGGSLAANAHARGLRFKPMIDDVESFVLLDAEGEFHTCSRRENYELFRLAIGGYGLFGVIVQVTLRLVRRRKVERVVRVIPVRDVLDAVQQRVDEGFLYGDCQYSTDIDGSNPDHPAVLSCYRPVEDDAPIAESRRVLTEEDWARLYVLARTDKKRAFEVYTKHYLGTDGQVYWSDTHQLAGRIDLRNLQSALVEQAGMAHPGSEMITEVYVRPDEFLPFLRGARQDIVEHGIDLTYGTIRFIEKDDESFLAWARERSICILCNLHVEHTEAGREKAAEDLRRLIGRAVAHGGRYFLTYHRWATRRQVETAYPQFVDFLRLKRKYDPQERFQSNWYRHYREMFADRL
jgi:FAD/FMN-containing dehydrogenase